MNQPPPSFSQRDLNLLKVYIKGTLDKDSVPEDKRWLFVYLHRIEIKVLLFYLLFGEYARCTGTLMHWYMDFTGIRIYPYHFFNTIKKIRLLLNLRQKAESDCDVELLQKLNSGEYKIYQSYQKYAGCKRVSFKNALSKYPELIKKIECRLRNSSSSMYNDDLSKFKWFVDSVNNLLIMKRGTKLTYSESINEDANSSC